MKEQPRKVSLGGASISQKVPPGVNARKTIISTLFCLYLGFGIPKGSRHQRELSCGTRDAVRQEELVECEDCLKASFKVFLLRHVRDYLELRLQIVVV